MRCILRLHMVVTLLVLPGAAGARLPLGRATAAAIQQPLGRWRRLPGAAPATTALYLAQLLAGASSAPRLSSLSAASLSLRAVRGGGEGEGADSTPVDIHEDPAALYAGFKTVAWENGGLESELAIGDWAAYKLGEHDAHDDWVKDLELDGALAFDPPMPEPLRLTHKPRVLVLYGSLRPESFSRKLAFECARILERLGCDVRVFNPQGLPLRDPAIDTHPKVQELRQLSDWSEGHVWVRLRETLQKVTIPCPKCSLPLAARLGSPLPPSLDGRGAP